MPDRRAAPRRRSGPRAPSRSGPRSPSSRCAPSRSARTGASPSCGPSSEEQLRPWTTSWPPRWASEAVPGSSHPARGKAAKGAGVRVAIAGAGGVGGLLAGLLARNGNEVSLLARGEHLRAIQQDGLRVETPEETFTVRVDASDAAGDLPKASALIVAVKTWQLPALVPQLGSLLREDGVAVPLLNGIESADVLAANLGGERVCGGLCDLFAWIQAPGVVRRAGVPPRVTVGELVGHGREHLEKLCDALRASRTDAVVTPDIRSALWEKLLFVGPLGAVGAAARVPAGRLRAVPRTRALL